jgi:hypothetical protein
MIYRHEMNTMIDTDSSSSVASEGLRFLLGNVPLGLLPQILGYLTLDIYTLHAAMNFDIHQEQQTVAIVVSSPPRHFHAFLLIRKPLFLRPKNLTFTTVERRPRL